MSNPLRALHAGPSPLLLVNAWDVASARVAAAGGAAAIGTTSFGVAAHRGLPDAELVPLDEVIALAAAIAGAVDVPVTYDLESGRGDIAATVAAVVDAGVVGVNIEDGAGAGSLRPTTEQAERLALVRSTAPDLFLNARCDVWFGGMAEPSVDEAIGRGVAYREAGADLLFVPGLLDVEVLARVSSATGLPLNVMAAPGMPGLDALAGAGVRRVSQGANLFLSTMGAIRRMTESYVSGAELVPSMDDLGRGARSLGALLA